MNPKFILNRRRRPSSDVGLSHSTAIFILEDTSVGILLLFWGFEAEESDEMILLL